MRTIKFRAWDPDDNEMYVPMVVAIRGMFEPSFKPLRRCKDGSNAFKDHVLMQFTGLFDRNGKEIYEGDIIKMNEIICEITFSDESFQMILDPAQGRGNAIQDRVRRFEVIGNIYQNPELLK